VPNLIHDEARQLWSRSLRDDDRVLVTGASGWFGRTTCALLDGLRVPVLLTASTAKDIEVGGSTFHCGPWDWTAIAEFRPTVVIDCAFLTRDRVADMDLAAYVATNETLTRNLLAAAGLPSVARVVTVSSGAAVYPTDALERTVEDNPYGWLKRRAEGALADVANERGIAVVVARAWSVSGAFVQKPRSYAFSDMILQAVAGSVHITAAAPVFRRYVAVEDLLSVALGGASRGAVRVIDSGGPLVEMQQLAEAVVSVVNPSAPITRVAQAPEGHASEYYSDGRAWESACAGTGFSPAALEQQVATAHAGLTPR
jgi:nucleoside-diphosphate-sugar epimerase